MGPSWKSCSIKSSWHPCKNVLLVFKKYSHEPWRKYGGARNFMGNHRTRTLNVMRASVSHGLRWPKPPALPPPHLAPTQHHVSGRKERRKDSNHKHQAGTTRETSLTGPRRRPALPAPQQLSDVGRARGAGADTGRNHTPTPNVRSRAVPASQHHQSKPNVRADQPTGQRAPPTVDPMSGRLAAPNGRDWKLMHMQCLKKAKLFSKVALMTKYNKVREVHTCKTC